MVRLMMVQILFYVYARCTCLGQVSCRVCRRQIRRSQSDLSSAMKNVAAPVVVNTIEPKTDLYLLLSLFRSGTTMAGRSAFPGKTTPGRGLNDDNSSAATDCLRRPPSKSSRAGSLTSPTRCSRGRGA